MTDSKYYPLMDICAVMSKNRLRGYILIALVFTVLFTSCLKKETPVTLPPPGTSMHAQVSMGEDYTTQVFFDLESGQVVYTSLVASWDLAFEATSGGHHLFMNGAKNVLIADTYDTSFSHVDSTAYASLINYPPDGAWKFDWPCGMPDSTGLGEWQDGQGNSLNHVYLVFCDSIYRKIKLRSVNDQGYVMEFGAINSATPTVISIPKNSNYNYTYFSFTAPGNITTPEPPMNTWDIVFTRYRYIYKYLGNFKYQVSGVLLNPYKTTGIADSTSGYDNISDSSLQHYTFYPWRDVIGFDWKSYDYTNANAKYVVNPKKSYVLATRRNQYWKIHFLDYYSPTGVKGSPLFEYERIK